MIEELYGADQTPLTHNPEFRAWYVPKNSTDAIFVRDHNGRIKYFSQYSTALQAACDAYEETYYGEE